MDIQKSYIITPAIIATILLVVAIPSGLPYGYYVFLRWAITAAALYIAWASYELKQIPWTWIFGIVAILFNPIIPVYLNKETWVVFDLVAILVFISVFFIKIKEKDYLTKE